MPDESPLRLHEESHRDRLQISAGPEIKCKLTAIFRHLNVRPSPVFLREELGKGFQFRA